MKSRCVIICMVFLLQLIIFSGCAKKAETDEAESGLEADQVDKSGQYLTYEYLDEDDEICKEDSYIIFVDKNVMLEDWEAKDGEKNYYLIISVGGNVYSYTRYFRQNSEHGQLMDYIYLGKLSQEELEYLNTLTTGIQETYDRIPISKSDSYWNYSGHDRKIWADRYFDVLPSEGVFQINQEGLCYCVVWMSDDLYGGYINSDENARKLMMWVMDSDYFQEWEQYRKEDIGNMEGIW